MSKSPAQLAIEALDEVAREQELIWGVDRLPRLVAAFDPDLAQRFWSQLGKLNAACEAGYLSEQEVQANRMRAAWLRLAQEAEAHGCLPLDPKFMETRLPNGRVLVVCADLASAHRMAHDDRSAVVWSLEEVARVAWEFSLINDVKTIWKGATVQNARVDPERTKPPVNWQTGDSLPESLLGAG